ncbi:MAG TPA: ABC transporter ATP-binding protein [Spirochaetia bacterium]|nr:ABC transporter ATP-binding protein [Spirochaetia bacterium]
MIEIDGLAFRYPGAHESALEHIGLTVPEGSVTVVAGESGSGKTTLLRLIAGFQVPSAGTIRIAGVPMSEAGRVVVPEERHVGVVFQDFALFPHLTVERNVEFGITRLSREARRRRVAECIDLLGITGLAARYPHELSGGQAQRVAIARALAPSPRIIVMDEPFNNLNVALRHELVPVVARVLRATGITSIVVTHDPHEAYELADEMILLKDGRIEQIGPPRELYESPQTRYVAHFFGPVNEIAVDSGLGRALAHERLPMIDNTTMIVRPERVSVTEIGAGITEAVVHDVRFAGDHLIAELSGDWDGLLRAHITHAELAPGARVGVAVDRLVPTH